MPIIQRSESDQGDSKGCDYLMKFDGQGDSPIWSIKDNAMDVQNADSVADYITQKYGYRLVVGSNKGNGRRQEILSKMKSGELPKDVAIQMLRENCPHDANR